MQSPRASPRRQSLGYSILPAVVAHLAFNSLKWSVLLVPGLDSVLPAALAQTEVLGAGGSVASLVALALAVFSILLLIGIEFFKRREIKEAGR